MKILFVSAEAAPLTKVGGLADVVRSLPAELRKRGHDVRVIVPQYGFADYIGYEIKPLIRNMVVFSLGQYRVISIKEMALNGVTTYLVSGDIFTVTSEVYGNDEIEKFFVLCDAVCEALSVLDWQPEIVHCHDWHAALLPLMLHERHPHCRSVFTIHNIRYQGNFDKYTMDRSGLSRYWQSSLADGSPVPLNFMSQGVLWSNVINTVSENFAREILMPENGYGMDGLLNFRKDNVFGIINGLGDEEYDPAIDALLPAGYSKTDLSGKRLNKEKLQNEAGLTPDLSLPLVCMVSRLDEQKGLDIIIPSLMEVLTDIEMQFVFLGKGQEGYEQALGQLEARFPHKLKAYISFDNRLAHLLYAGADLFLMPSKWEPCGLSQMIAMKYGTVPLVRKTGGLADTVSGLSNDLKTGTGFVFTEYSAGALSGMLKKAAAEFKKKQAWQQVIRRIMQQDFSWAGPAAKYEVLYKKAMELS